MRRGAPKPVLVTKIRAKNWENALDLTFFDCTWRVLQALPPPPAPHRGSEGRLMNDCQDNEVIVRCAAAGAVLVRSVRLDVAACSVPRRRLVVAAPCHPLSTCSAVERLSRLKRPNPRLVDEGLSANAGFLEGILHKAHHNRPPKPEQRPTHAGTPPQSTSPTDSLLEGYRE